MSEPEVTDAEVDEALVEADLDEATADDAVVASEVVPGDDDEAGDVGDADSTAEVAAEADDDLDDLLGLAGADPDATPAADAVEAQDAAAGEGDQPDTDGADGPDAVDHDEADGGDASEDAPPQRARRPRPESIEDVQERRDLLRMQGDWFVVHTYSGYEQRVKDNLANRAEAVAGGDRIFETVIPTEEVTEFKKGKKQVVQKKFLPGYVLVRMELDDESWNLVRHTPAVTGFVGASANKPVPLSSREVASTLSIPEKIEEEVEEDEHTKQAARAAVQEIDMEVGETVRVTEGPFADFEGTIAEINLDQAKLRLLMNVFGRETPLELKFDKVAKVT